MSPSPRLPLLLAASLLAALPAKSALNEGEPAAPESPWELAALGLFKDANRAFAQAPAADREARFGQAATLINLQPKTDANLTRADSLLADVASENPADSLGVAARYLRARIAHIHRLSPDPAAALALYRELADSRVDHPLAQRALVQIALLELFEADLSADQLRARHAALADRDSALTEPSARRDFNLVLGDAALRLGLPDHVALDHLLRADQAGVARDLTRRDNWLRIAELARRAGRPDVAIAHYERFLAATLRDARRLDVEQRLAALRAADNPSAASTASAR
jgi:hypothetical protein